MVNCRRALAYSASAASRGRLVRVCAGMGKRLPLWIGSYGTLRDEYEREDLFERELLYGFFRT